MLIWCCLDLYLFCAVFVFFFFKQKTAYEMRISDWSSDVCSSDLLFQQVVHQQHVADRLRHLLGLDIDEAVVHPVAAEQPAAMGAGALGDQIGRASCRERVCQYV